MDVSLKWELTFVNEDSEASVSRIVLLIETTSVERAITVCRDDFALPEGSWKLQRVEPREF